MFIFVSFVGILSILSYYLSNYKRSVFHLSIVVESVLWLMRLSIWKVNLLSWVFLSEWSNEKEAIFIDTWECKEVEFTSLAIFYWRSKFFDGPDLYFGWLMTFFWILIEGLEGLNWFLFGTWKYIFSFAPFLFIFSPTY